MKNVVKSCIGIGLVASLGAFGCGGDGGGDTPGQDSAPPTGEFSEFVLNGLELPVGTRVDTLSFDLDGVRDPSDNALGSVISLLAGFEFELQPSVDSSIAGGDVVILHAIQAESLASGNASWQVFLGEATATPPAFDGNDTFVRDTSGPTNAVLPCTITGGVADCGPGNVSLSLALVAGQPPLEISLVGARISATVSATGATNGILGGAITQDDVENEIIPAIADVMTGYMAADCDCTEPSGPITCTADSTGETLDTMFNTTHDCAITGPELLGSAIVQAAIMPDVDMFNGDAFEPGVDGEDDSLSLGVGFTAVGADFDRPGEN